MDINTIKEVWKQLTPEQRNKVNNWVEKNVELECCIKHKTQVDSITDIQSDTLPSYTMGETVDFTPTIIPRFHCKKCNRSIVPHDTPPEIMIINHVLDKHLKSILEQSTA